MLIYFVTTMFGRFTGTEFPPKIVFKVFISSGGFGIKYFSGKKVITPASEVSDPLSLNFNTCISSGII